MYREQLISQSTKKDLEDFIFQIPAERRSFINEIGKEILYKSIPLAKKRNNNQAEFFKSVESIIMSKINQFSQKYQNLFRRSIIAKLALGLPKIVEQKGLPDSILVLYPKAFDRLSNHLKNNVNDPYELSDDFFRKDISFVSGISIPCGAQVVDPKSYFLYRSVGRAFLRSGNLKALGRFFRIGGTGPWFGIHTESRYLDDFNEPGWDACYLRIADLLERNPSIRGMKGTSWFYDPQLISISPHLSYLQKRPLERGAFMIRHGTNSVDIELSTLTSKTRRSLYKEGKYIPVSYTLLWPRRDLISWAESYRSKNKKG